MNQANKLIAVLFANASIWGGFESYHQMRMHEFLSFPSIGYAVLSVSLVFLGGLIAAAVRGEQ